MTTRDIAELIYSRICGTCEDIIAGIDTMIEEGEIDREYFRANELDILGIVDSLMFNCAVCGWTVDTSDFSMECNMSGPVCVDCGDDES